MVTTEIKFFIPSGDNGNKWVMVTRRDVNK